MIRYPQCLVCGHNKSRHGLSGTSCNDCWEEHGISLIDRGYHYYRHNYIPDNLGHIERLAKVRKLI
jgi:hypothetical protein